MSMGRYNFRISQTRLPLSYQDLKCCSISRTQFETVKSNMHGTFDIELKSKVQPTLLFGLRNAEGGSEECFEFLGVHLY